MKSMFDENKKIINESMPYLTMGGVFTQKASSLSNYVDVNDRMQLRKAIMDMFTLYPVVSDDMIGKLAEVLQIPEPMLENEIYAILSSFFNKGKSRENPNMPIDPTQLQMGIQVEFEHTDDPFIAEKIARDHLAELPAYYTYLAEMEARYGSKS